MGKNSEDNPFKEMEKWMEHFFLDPLTSYLDQSAFRIDIYETDAEYIVEALLTDFTAAMLSVILNGHELIIRAEKDKETVSREVDFPFLITEKLVTSRFSCGILEVFISKTSKGSGKDRKVPVQ
ncbi:MULTISPECIES: Hsp20/alpha crystallin family protein [Bacillus]|jgi:HSP20 family molecular chaperone IbpA|uniref:Hsp20/alpha crystallin family protein n=1 Tax=Bacillus TaxID=1386 RepID=UPI000C781558|nr:MULTISPECIES: Hsp20/alpha crystallin family protein [Bacillus]MCR6610817.1 Hsp20/alpha crystallin family protein [Bacillus infantis]MDT0159046.1 Hsp20/alpha crystallin family protein [Bacillus sp. AG4(2022)]PLR74413.1 heat-shock protein Hsp20 [Bacillus sp. UMB0728]RYI30255.1 Hsp20/alpha crystallin family protein [Bacillus infantis]